MFKKIHLVPLILLYMLMYNPPIFAFGSFRFNCVWVVMPIALIYLFMNRKKLAEEVNLRGVLLAEGAMALILAYCLLIALIHKNPLTGFAHTVYWIAADVPFALAVWVYLRKKGEGFRELLDHALAAGTVMAVTAVVSFLVPSVHMAFARMSANYGAPLAIERAEFRDFGFAANLTCTASYVQAILAVIALYLAVRGRKGGYLLFPLLAFSANINTRTSTPMIAVGMIAVFVALLVAKDYKMAWKFVLIAAGYSVAALFGLRLVRMVNYMTYKWLSSGMGEILSFIFGDEMDDTYFTMLEEMVSPGAMPRGLDLIFGTGASIEHADEFGNHTDLGFINDLWRGGLVYSIAITGLFFYTLWRMAKSPELRRQDGVFLLVLSIGTWLITNIKGAFFIHGDVTVLFALLLPPLVWQRRKKLTGGISA